MEKYAYVRVSTKEQNIDRQLIALSQFNVPKRNVYCDYQSGKNFDRPEYKKLIKRLHPGDLLVLKSIDRLGRNYEEILLQWQFITKEIKADIVVLDMELLDTRKKDNNLTGILISDLVLQLFAYVAQIEREFIHQRQAEGIAAAKERGQQFGRKPISMPGNFEDVCRECSTGRLSSREGAEKLGLSHTTFCRRYKEWREKQPVIKNLEEGEGIVPKRRHNGTA